MMFELTRWLEENRYKWDSVVSAKYQYTARALGIFADRGNYMVGAYSKDDFILNVERKAFNELKMMLPLHWATILLDWYPVLINGIDNKEMIEFGNLMIVCSEEKMVATTIFPVSMKEDDDDFWTNLYIEQYGDPECNS